VPVINNFGLGIGKYDGTTGAAINTNFITGLSSTPVVLALSGNNLFVTVKGPNEIGDSKVSEYDATTGALINANFIRGLNQRLGLAVFGNNIFVADFFSGTVGKYNATTGAVINANFMVLCNNLFVANSIMGIVDQYDATTGALINVLNTGGSPKGVAVSGNNLFVIPYIGNTVGKCDVTTGPRLTPTSSLT
jgi:hypothetical protein